MKFNSTNINSVSYSLTSTHATWLTLKSKGK